jgi:N-acetylglucosamine-6-phosphate deacetylase
VTTLFHGARKLDANGEVDDFWMLVDGDTITQTGSGLAPDASTKVDVGGKWFVPGFIDIHGHGGGGHSYDDGQGELLAAIATHRAHGTTRSVISLVANPMANLRSSLGVIANLAADDPLILGSHLEGPFLAPDNRGAHNLDYLRDPEPREVEELIGAARGTLRQITIAPER